MNTGLGNLNELKTHLLAEQLREDTAYDAALTALGLGVASAFEKFCDRKFQRTVGDTYVASADGEIYYLPRAPIEELTSLDLRVNMEDGWQVQAGLILTLEELIGKVQLATTGLDFRSQFRFTFTGGYWWNTNEEGTDALPPGATALPDDLKLAWLLQCKKTWEVYDPTGTGIAKGGSSVQLVGLSLAGLELIPAVKDMLAPHRRLFS